MSIMTSAAFCPIATATPQIEPANFLNLLIVDDERSIREACREVAQSLGFTTFVADFAEHAYRFSTPKPSTPFCWICACPAREAWKRCAASKSAGRKPSSLW